jgi:hypothetical protein
MNFNDYISLTQEQQLDLLTDKGIRVGRRVDEEYNITLYKMDGFLVEVFFNRKQLLITQLSVIGSTKIPDVYSECEDFIGQSSRPPVTRLIPIYYGNQQ